MQEAMDVIKKKLFYRTAKIICCLFCLLSWQIAISAPLKAVVLHPSGLLWKIQKPEHEHSYLFGTIHISDARVLKLVDVVQDSLKESDIFAMEVVLDQAAQETLTLASFFSDDKESLHDYVNDKTFDRIVSIMDQYYGITPDVVDRMKPWAVMATISSPPPESNQAVLDIELQNLAIEYQRPVVALETLEEQIEALSDMEMSDQIWILKKAVEDFEQSTSMWEQMIESYLHRDLQALMQSQELMMDENSTIDDRFMDKLLDQRNIKMAKRMMAIMKNKSVFVAIGALHLPGEKGVLHILEQAGYQVSRVY